MISRWTSRWIGTIPARLRLPLLVYAVTQLILLAWWASYYPGLMSYDSISYVWHVTTNHWMANHSVAYDGLVWLSLKTGGGLGPLTFLQTVAAAAVLAYTADVLHALGVRARWAATAAVATVVLPTLGTFVVFVWKDVPFTLSAVLAFAATGRLVARRRAGATGFPARAVGLLALGFLGLALFRNNGFLTAMIAAPILIVALSGLRRAIAVATIVPIIVSFVLTGWVYPALGVQGAEPALTYASAYADVSVAYVQRPDTFTKADKRLMTQVAPLDHWAYAGSNCYNSDWLTNKPGFSKSAANRLNDRLLDLWMRTIKRSPDVVVGARICRGSIAWAVFPGPAYLGGHTAVGPSQIPKDRFSWALPGGRMEGSPYLSELKIRPLSQPVHDAAEFTRRLSLTPQFEWLLQRAPIWCYLGYLAIGLYAWRRRTPAAWALAAVIVGGQLGVLAANPAQLFRYMTAPMMLGILTLPLLTTPRRTRAEAQTDEERTASSSSSASASASDSSPSASSSSPGLTSGSTSDSGSDSDAGDAEDAASGATASTASAGLRAPGTRARTAASAAKGIAGGM
ncbi:hypothetical protein J4573_15310 [Actinomadura barringtoniae]|uniref:Uncharacterized protein n=1 Tax=Actinomadura barringtoniae TaxID=1427535 RepID=A0A939PEY6_9ACTN|nr:DUF6020 family protein [Actinomadura barringtoniae]MBO2448469.1 hypothetical protein [Actinomadura barringtoniae]